MKTFLLLCLSFMYLHGDNVATFTISKNNNTLEIKANLDINDIEKALKTKIYKVTESTIENYLLEHVEFKINNELIPFTLKGFKTKNHHFVINYSLNKEVENITELEIKNTLLLDVNDKQANVIQLRFDGLFRDFLINKQKPILKIKL